MLRTCKKCKVEKDLDLFSKSSNCVHGRGHVCKSCTSARAREIRKPYDSDARKAYYIANKEKENENSRLCYEKNKEHYKKRHKQWAQANPEKMSAYRVKHYNKIKENLDDSFIKHLLTSGKYRWSKKLMPKEIIDVKRLQVLLNRKLK